MEQRNFLAFEYYKYRGTRNFKEGILERFQARFPGSRLPSKNQMTNIYRKQQDKGTVNNSNSKSSPGETYSGRQRTVRTPGNAALVKAVMDRDATKVGRHDKNKYLLLLARSTRRSMGLEWPL